MLRLHDLEAPEARRIHPALVIAHTIRKHSPGLPESLANRPCISIFEMLNHHEQHASQCTLAPRPRSHFPRLYRRIEARDAGSQFFRDQEERSDGYRVSPSDERRGDRENWPQPCGLRRKSAHTSFSSSALEPTKPSDSAPGVPADRPSSMGWLSSEPIFAQQRTHLYMSIQPSP